MEMRHCICAFLNNAGTLRTDIKGRALPGGANLFPDVLGNEAVVYRATKIVKLWVPGTKFGRKGKIVYENQSSQVKFFDCQLVVYAYSNYSTSQDIFFVGRVNDCVKQMFFKDGWNRKISRHFL